MTNVVRRLAIVARVEDQYSQELERAERKADDVADSWRSLERAIADTDDQLDSIRTTIDRTGDSIERGRRTTRKFADSITDVSDESARMVDALDSSGDEISSVREDLITARERSDEFAESIERVSTGGSFDSLIRDIEDTTRETEDLARAAERLDQTVLHPGTGRRVEGEGDVPDVANVLTRFMGRGGGGGGAGGGAGGGGGDDGGGDDDDDGSLRDIGQGARRRNRRRLGEATSGFLQLLGGFGRALPGVKGAARALSSMSPLAMAGAGAGMAGLTGLATAAGAGAVGAGIGGGLLAGGIALPIKLNVSEGEFEWIKQQVSESMAPLRGGVWDQMANQAARDVPRITGMIAQSVEDLQDPITETFNEVRGSFFRQLPSILDASEQAVERLDDELSSLTIGAIESLPGIIRESSIYAEGLLGFLGEAGRESGPLVKNLAEFGRGVGELAGPVTIEFLKILSMLSVPLGWLGKLLGGIGKAYQKAEQLETFLGTFGGAINFPDWITGQGPLIMEGGWLDDLLSGEFSGGLLQTPVISPGNLLPDGPIVPTIQLPSLPTLTLDIMPNFLGGLGDLLSGATGERSGRALAGGFARGTEQNQAALEGAMSSLTGTAASYLPSSDADRGPLSDLYDRGRALPATLGAGIDQTRRRAVAPVSRTAGDMASALPDRLSTALGLSRGELRTGRRQRDGQDRLMRANRPDRARFGRQLSPRVRQSVLALPRRFRGAEDVLSRLLSVETDYADESIRYSRRTLRRLENVGDRVESQSSGFVSAVGTAIGESVDQGTEPAEDAGDAIDDIVSGDLDQSTRGGLEDLDAFVSDLNSEYQRIYREEYGIDLSQDSTREETINELRDAYESDQVSDEELLDILQNEQFGAGMSPNEAGAVFSKLSSDEWEQLFQSDGESAGEGLMATFADGISSNADDPASATQGAMGETAAYLPSSDADRGPLANLHERARSIPAIFGAEIDRSDAPARAAESMAGAIADASQPDSSPSDFMIGATPLPDQRPVALTDRAASGSVSTNAGMSQTAGQIHVDSINIEPHVDLTVDDASDGTTIADEIANAMPRMVRDARRETIRELEDMLRAAVDGQGVQTPPAGPGGS